MPCTTNVTFCSRCKRSVSAKVLFGRSAEDVGLADAPRLLQSILKG